MMVLHPEVQSIAQAEIDTLVDVAPISVLAERDRVRYIDAIFAEVLRLLPPIPASSSVPHHAGWNLSYHVIW